MASGMPSSSIENTSAFEFDEIETNDELKSLAYLLLDVNDAITQPPLGADDYLTDHEDMFLARLEAIDSRLAKIYQDRRSREFFWLRLPQPSKGTDSSWILSLGY